MAQLESVTPENWREFVEAEASVLVLGTTTCEACAQWSEELTAYLAMHPEAFGGVRLGKLMLDQGGFIDFKRDNAWLARVTDLPYNIIYRNGEPAKRYVGGGIDRLVRCLEKVL